MSFNKNIKQFLKTRDSDINSQVKDDFQAFEHERNRLGTLIQTNKKHNNSFQKTSVKKNIMSESKDYKLSNQEKYFEQMRMTCTKDNRQEAFKKKKMHLNCLKQLYTEQIIGVKDNRQFESTALLDNTNLLLKNKTKDNKFSLKETIINKNNINFGIKHRRTNTLQKLHLVGKNQQERANEKLYVGLYNPNYNRIQNNAQNSFTINPIRKREQNQYYMGENNNYKQDSLLGNRKDVTLVREKEFNNLISGINLLGQVHDEMVNDQNKVKKYNINKMFAKELDLDLEQLQDKMLEKINYARQIHKDRPKYV